MQFTWAAPLVLLTLAAAVVADVDFLVPSAGSSAKGGDVITVHWRDSGNPPMLSDLTRYSLALCAGGDTEDSFVNRTPFNAPNLEVQTNRHLIGFLTYWHMQEEVATLIEDGVFARGNSVSFQINAGVGSNDRNA